MSYVGTNPYSGQYPVVVQPPYRSMGAYSTGAYGPMGPYGFMGPYGPTLPYGSLGSYGPPPQQGYDSHTQNLLFYICAVSFMCAFVVLMVYSAIAMRRQLNNLSTEDGSNRSSAASKTDVTSATTPPLFEWRQPDDQRTGDRDGVRNENIVPDPDHILEDTPDERKSANRRHRLPVAPQSDAITKTTRLTAVTGRDVKRLPPSSSVIYRPTTAPTRASSRSSLGTKSFNQTTNKGNSQSASETTGHLRTMAEWFRRWSRSSDKSPATTSTTLKDTPRNETSESKDLKGHVTSDATKADVGTMHAFSAQRHAHRNGRPAFSKDDPDLP